MTKTPSDKFRQLDPGRFSNVTGLDETPLKIRQGTNALRRQVLLDFSQDLHQADAVGSFICLKIHWSGRPLRVGDRTQQA